MATIVPLAPNNDGCPDHHAFESQLLKRAKTEHNVALCDRGYYAYLTDFYMRVIECAENRTVIRVLYQPETLRSFESDTIHFRFLVPVQKVRDAVWFMQQRPYTLPSKDVYIDFAETPLGPLYFQKLRNIYRMTFQAEYPYASTWDEFNNLGVPHLVYTLMHGETLHGTGQAAEQHKTTSASFLQSPDLPAQLTTNALATAFLRATSTPRRLDYASMPAYLRETLASNDAAVFKVNKPVVVGGDAMEADAASAAPEDTMQQ